MLSVCVGVMYVDCGFVIPPDSGVCIACSMCETDVQVVCSRPAGLLGT